MGQDIYSVFALVHYIKWTLGSDIRIQSTPIKEEISNLTNHRNGHWYFTLKDARSKISCIMSSSHARYCNILSREGMKATVTASVSIYEAGGSIQLYVTAVHSDGLGDLFLQLEEVKKKSAIQGLFDPQKKRPLPQYPICIGVIIAKTGATVQDILTTISWRWLLAEVAVYPNLVQGIQASGAVVENLRKTDQGRHDVILLTRGGRPVEDLWCFNKEAIARTMFAIYTVAVTGASHETDATLADYVLDARAPIPTTIAELVTPDLEEVRMNVSLMRRWLVKDVEAHLHMAKQALEPIHSHRYMRDPLGYIREEEMKFATHVQQLSVVEAAVVAMAIQLKWNSHKLAVHSEYLFQENTRSIAKSRLRLTQTLYSYDMLRKCQIRSISTLLGACSPLRSLSRGYAIAYHGDEVISGMDAVEQDDRLRSCMQDGYLCTSIEKKKRLQWNKNYRLNNP